MISSFIVLITVIMAELEIAEPTVINCKTWLNIVTTSEIWIIYSPLLIIVHDKHPFLSCFDRNVSTIG